MSKTIRTATLRAFSPMRALKAIKIEGVDLGTLQADFVASGKALKTANRLFDNAANALEAARSKHNSNSEKLKSASRAVLADS